MQDTYSPMRIDPVTRNKAENERECYDRAYNALNSKIDGLEGDAKLQALRAYQREHGPAEGRDEQANGRRNGYRTTKPREGSGDLLFSVEAYHETTWDAIDRKQGQIAAQITKTCKAR